MLQKMYFTKQKNQNCDQFNDCDNSSTSNPSGNWVLPPRLRVSVEMMGVKRREGIFSPKSSPNDHSRMVMGDSNDHVALGSVDNVDGGTAVRIWVSSGMISVRRAKACVLEIGLDGSQCFVLDDLPPMGRGLGVWEGDCGGGLWFVGDLIMIGWIVVWCW